jgi:Fe(3+) dicitrate transport protein
MGHHAGRTGLQLDFLRKQGDGAREHVSSEVHDVTAKVVSRLSERHVLTLRGSYFSEDSNLTYSGLREDEYEADPRQNPFSNDFFYVDRYGASATHTFTISRTTSRHDQRLPSRTFSGTGGGSRATPGQRPNRASDPACGGMANLHTTCGNEGRLRSYDVGRGAARARRGQARRVGSETDFGVRAHFEDQQRRQENGATPTARSGVARGEQRSPQPGVCRLRPEPLHHGRLSVTPGVRSSGCTTSGPTGSSRRPARPTSRRSSRASALAYSASPRHTFFAGVHRGFTPPRTEDIINNTTGALDRPRAGAQLELRGGRAERTAPGCPVGGRVVPDGL